VGNNLSLLWNYWDKRNEVALQVSSSGTFEQKTNPFLTRGSTSMFLPCYIESETLREEPLLS